MTSPGSLDPRRSSSAPRKPEVDPATFFALDIRVGRITELAPFPEARSPAWKLVLDFGPSIGRLQSSAQLAHIPREALVGRPILAVVNLGVKRVAGFASECLVLGVYGPDGAVILLDVPSGVEPGGVVG